MKIIITGASGKIGSALVPRLSSRGFQLLLVGRDVGLLRLRFPGIQSCSYDQLQDLAAGYDFLLNLAVVNSDSDASYDEFVAVNADLPTRLATLAGEQGVGCFVYMSTVHALDEELNTPYARSKRLGREQLNSANRLDICTVYLPAVRGESFSGRWSVLNHLPGTIRKPVANILSTLKPIVDAETLSAKLCELFTQPNRPRETVISNGQAGNVVYQTLRRVIDIAASVTIIVFLWWLLLIVWGVIRLKSEGPGLFAQQRVGRNGRIFTCYKFRTMLTGTRQAATHEITSSSVTSIGKVLRRTKLDELPQVWNLLKGDMTLVGPRPSLPSQTELIERRRNSGVLEIPPGITGLAQVNGIDMSIPERLVIYDQRYLGLQSLLLDVKILMLTITGRGSGDRVSV